MQANVSKFNKGKQNLDNILSMRVNFRKEGLGYAPNKKKAFENKVKTSFVHASLSPSTSKAKAVSNVISKHQSFVTKTRNTLSHAQINYAPTPKRQSRSQHVHTNHVRQVYATSSMNVTCHYCGMFGHVNSYCQLKKNEKKMNLIWVRKDLIASWTNKQGPKTVWVPKSNV
jgi:hypothetical protein